MNKEEIIQVIKEYLSEPITLKFKRLSQDAKAPLQKNASDSCWDLFATTCHTEDNYIEYGTGIALEIPKGYEVKIFPRSSVSNTGLVLANSVAVIDESYVSEVMIRFKSIAPYPGRRYIIGDRIAQLQLVKRVPTVLEEVTEITETGRGKFGSTGA